LAIFFSAFSVCISADKYVQLGSFKIKKLSLEEMFTMAAATTAKRMTQTEIISQLAEKSGMKKTEAKEFFTALAALATSEVKKNGEFTLPGFGKLVKATRKAREGRNPATGKPIKIPAKTTVKFRLGKAMKDAVGGGK
jgi:DNA-binding protein HU-beta